MNIKFTKDSRIQGLIKIKKADFSLCKKAKCIHFDRCTALKPDEIECIYKDPLFKVTASEFNLDSEEYGKLRKFKAYMKRFLIRKKYANTFHNDTNQTFLNDLAKYVEGLSTPNLKAQFIGLSSAFTAPDKNSVLELEVGRVVPTAVRTNSQVVLSASFGLVDANTLSTTVASPISATQFTVTSVTGLQVGDRVCVTLSALGNRPEEREVSAISATTVTLANALSLTPTAGDTFKQMISRVQVVHGGATSTLNSGSATSIASYIETKSSTDTLDITYEITFI